MADFFLRVTPRAHRHRRPHRARRAVHRRLQPLLPLRGRPPAAAARTSPASPTSPAARSRSSRASTSRAAPSSSSQVCHGFNNPPSVGCRNGPKGQTVHRRARQDDPAARSARVNGLGVSEGEVVRRRASTRSSSSCPASGLDQAQGDRRAPPPSCTSPPPSPGAPNPADPQVPRRPGEPLRPHPVRQHAVLPAGYHWKIDDALDASDVQSADVGTDSDGPDRRQHHLQRRRRHASGTRSPPRRTPSRRQSPTAPPPQAQVAIFLDNEIITAPDVQGPSSNQTQITGGFTSRRRRPLASEISAGALPAEIATVQSNEVSATPRSADRAAQPHRRRGRAADHRALHDRLLPLPRAARLPRAGRLRRPSSWRSTR